ncbi:terpene cyclase/mutase family protein [Streptomyces sp. B1866]|uniref:prenyltransferase/squalene oxidase repeat-containing protein n=1 Tax=Streptomyces sp. B1866 TaxID=3075431 RepID=UPI00288DAEE3|nr:prenyltransferase/squalene oxidase repeat-containing protein [Streptomyces sp. B1866]MDT3398245.1 terpene cyclase/mutase family protein [Streptomyces sp. B1866]
MITAALLPSPARISPAGARLPHCRDRLAGRLAACVDGRGLVPAPCGSRVLESALLFALLTELAPGARERGRLAAHLTRALEGPGLDPVQTAAARAVLGRAVAGQAHAERVLSGFDHFTAGRKRLMFLTVLAELGAARYPDAPLEEFDARGQQSWLVLEMTALKVMAAYGTGRPEAVTARDWSALAPAARPGPVWEGNYLARLLGLLALARHPGHRAAAAEAAVRTAGELRADGGLPFITGMDVFATATAGLALAGCRYAGAPLDAMADALAAVQHADGGFGFTPGVGQSDVDDTAYCTEFLRAVAARRHARAVEAAEDYLVRQANTDGGFPTFARGTPSEVAMTAAAVNALAPSERHRRAAEAGLRFLTSRRRPAGMLERSWSRNATNAVFRVTLACDAVTAGAPDDLRRAAAAVKERVTGYLARAQARDGGWGHAPGEDSDPISTAYAVIALSRVPARSAMLRRAVEYLAERQRPDGGFTSRPDQAGPRPLVYDVPVLADVCVLMAFAHALGPRGR